MDLVFDSPVHVNGCIFADPTVLVVLQGGSGTRAVEVKGYKLTAAQIDQIKREDEEIVIIMTIIGEHLL